MPTSSPERVCVTADKALAGKRLASGSHLDLATAPGAVPVAWKAAQHTSMQAVLPFGAAQVEIGEHSCIIHHALRTWCWTVLYDKSADAVTLTFSACDRP